MDDICFHLNKGEFSEKAEEAFEKHLSRLIKYDKKFKNENGKRMDLILQQEPLWFSQARKTASCYDTHKTASLGGERYCN